MTQHSTIRIFVDADACPVKDEIYRVAGRYSLPTFIVSNQWLLVPQTPLIERVVVEQGPDVADDWIAEQAGARDIVVTNDIPLAARCIASGSSILRPDGRVIDEHAIGGVKAVRDLMDSLRETGVATTRNPPFSKQSRSAFLSALDTMIVRLKKRAI
ncbi:YaiI/YqxD family protein [Kozakia baliensis]|uniref:YaiI/YqxD family protein n=1 Tax=Kozakia baliensis TaxID=153496 RepID=UPI0004977518|nr:YaiI/YqxD family protein [Kozakia baliensis]